MAAEQNEAVAFSQDVEDEVMLRTTDLLRTSRAPQLLTHRDWKSTGWLGSKPSEPYRPLGTPKRIPHYSKLMRPRRGKTPSSAGRKTRNSREEGYSSDGVFAKSKGWEPLVPKQDSEFEVRVKKVYNGKNKNRGMDVDTEISDAESPDGERDPRSQRLRTKIIVNARDSTLWKEILASERRKQSLRIGGTFSSALKAEGSTDRRKRRLPRTDETNQAVQALSPRLRLNVEKVEDRVLAFLPDVDPSQRSYRSRVLTVRKDDMSLPPVSQQSARLVPFDLTGVHSHHIARVAREEIHPQTVLTARTDSALTLHSTTESSTCSPRLRSSESIMKQVKSYCKQMDTLAIGLAKKLETYLEVLQEEREQVFQQKFVGIQGVESDEDPNRFLGKMRRLRNETLQRRRRVTDAIHAMLWLSKHRCRCFESKQNSLIGLCN